MRQQHGPQRALHTCKRTARPRRAPSGRRDDFFSIPLLSGKHAHGFGDFYRNRDARCEGAVVESAPTLHWPNQRYRLRAKMRYAPSRRPRGTMRNTQSNGHGNRMPPAMARAASECKSTLPSQMRMSESSGGGVGGGDDIVGAVGGAFVIGWRARAG